MLWKPLSSRRVLKTLRENPKRTIFASGGLELLQESSSHFGCGSQMAVEVRTSSDGGNNGCRVTSVEEGEEEPGFDEGCQREGKIKVICQVSWLNEQITRN